MLEINEFYWINTVAYNCEIFNNYNNKCRTTSEMFNNNIILIIIW